MTSSATHMVLPGSTIGILGSGQLGRMAAIAARRLGYHVWVYSPESNSPAGAVADREWAAPWDDASALRKFAQGVDVITLEFENVPLEAARLLERMADERSNGAKLHPSSTVLDTAQHRIREKAVLREAGFSVAPSAPIRTSEDLAEAVRSLGTPAILKTSASGYDGKGQIRIDASDDAEAAWKELGEVECIYESFVDFACEVSVVAARSSCGATVDFGVFANDHSNHILDVTVCPAQVPASVLEDARSVARSVMEQLDVVGVMCIEFFVLGDDSVVINEIAPRPHNSGHLTIDACITDQFEQQIRSVCGLPLGSTEMVAPAACMVNLLGDLWSEGEPRWSAALSDPAVKLHLYGKHEARVGRKMGHLTVVGATVADVRDAALRARDRLTNDL